MAWTQNPKRFLKRDLALYFSYKYLGISRNELAKLYKMNRGRVWQIVDRERSIIDGE